MPFLVGFPNMNVLSLVIVGTDLDESTVEGLVREFAASWKSGIEAINQDVLAYFSNFRNGMEILKQVPNYSVFHAITILENEKT